MERKRRSLNKKQRKWLFARDQEHIHALVQGHQENEGLGHGLDLESVSTESDHARAQEKERGSHHAHTPVKEELEKGRRNDKRRDYLQFGLKH